MFYPPFFYIHAEFLLVYLTVITLNMLDCWGGNTDLVEVTVAAWSETAVRLNHTLKLKPKKTNDGDIKVLKYIRF